MFSTCVGQVSFPQISKATALKSRDVTDKYKIYTFRQVRDLMFKSSPESFLHQHFDNDTLYMMESWLLEGNSYWGIIWNRKDRIYYQFDNHEFTFPMEDIRFQNYWMALIGRWDTSRITKEYKTYGTSVSPNPVYATRIQIRNGKISVDKYYFYHYFLKDNRP